MIGSPNNSTEKQINRLSQRIASINKGLILVKCQNRTIRRSLLRMKIIIVLETFGLIGLGLFVFFKTLALG